MDDEGLRELEELEHHVGLDPLERTLHEPEDHPSEGIAEDEGDGDRDDGPEQTAAKLVQMLEYKAIRVGIRVIRVDEAYTSQRCSQCGLICKTNRISRGLYHCRRCSFQVNADHNAARNIVQKYLKNLDFSQVGV